jgi:tetratricopeptide (TPR) repeat protein
VALALAVVGSPLLAGRAAEVRRRAYELLNEGVTAYKNGDFPAAIDKLRESSGLALNSFRAYFYLGLALSADRRYTEAVESLNIALDLDPAHLQSLVALGDAQWKLGDLAEADAAYFRALKLRPEYADALDGLARVRESRGQIELAVTTFQRAIASNRGFAPAYTHLGDLYLREGRFEEAVHLLEEAVSARPDFAAGLNRLALAYGRLGLSNEAIATIQRARELEPKNADHPATLGLLQLGEGSTAAAETSFAAALALDSAQPEALAGLAEIARRAGDYGEASRRLDQALADPRLDSPRATRLKLLKDNLLAEQTEVRGLEEHLAAGSAAPAERERLARIYALRSQWGKAIELEQSLPADRAQRERLAYLLFRSSRFREAHEIYAGLRADDPSAAAALNDGVALALLGDDAGAIAAFEKALETDPQNGTARVFLANAYLRTGNTAGAIAAYKQFLDAGAQGERAERVRRILAQLAPGLIPPQPTPKPAAPEVVPTSGATP